jgi:hypothetical protein
MEKEKAKSKLVGEVEAAQILGDLKPHTLRRWRCVGTVNLPYIKIGGAVRYRESDLYAFIESRVVAKGKNSRRGRKAA